jgi:transcriptional regulator with XRE-family HTH domain
MKYGKAIKIIRNLKDVSQKELGSMVNVDPSYISLIEAGDRTPSLDLMELISKKLDVPLNLLILMATEDSDLKNISEKDAEEIGKELVSLLINIKKK